MAKAMEPAVATEEIVFELERFERVDGRLTLTGRWFGVRGRRFVRPTLTLAVDGERVRALADLEDKPWPAEDGEPWQASFPWSKGGRATEAELSVAPDITIQLPAPGSRRARPQRITAQPRREAMDASWAALGAAVEAEPLEASEAVEVVEASEAEAGATQSLAAPSAAEPAPPPPPPDPEVLQGMIDALRGELAEAEAAAAALRAELDPLRDELAATRAQLEQAQRELGGRGGELETAQTELGATRAAREAALRNAAQAEAEREDALTRAMQAETERDALVAERKELTAALQQSRSTAEQLTRQHNEAMATRGAALVMRGATQAMPAYERHVGWWRRALVVLVLLGIAAAVLAVLGAL